MGKDAVECYTGESGRETYLVLGGAHRQHGHRDAIELVEAAPGARLGQPLVDLPHGLVVHLVAAVEDVALHAQGAGQVLGGLRLARACGQGARVGFGVWSQQVWFAQLSKKRISLVVTAVFSSGMGSKSKLRESGGQQ